MGETRLSLTELKSLAYYTPELGSEYLRRVRGMIILPNSLRAVKRRKSKATGAKMRLTNITLWTRPELDAIEKTSWTKTVEPEKEETEGEGENFPSVLFSDELYGATHWSLSQAVATAGV